jgi:hypothetical protein
MKAMAAMSEMVTVTIAPGSSHQPRHSFNGNPPIKKHCAAIIADRIENARWKTKTLLHGFEILSALLAWMNVGWLHAEQVGPRYVVRTLQICLFLALACSCAAAFDSDRTIAQFAHTVWGPKDGAPSAITALAQTPDGYLWVGGPDGLYRFDGVVFERYQPQSGDPFPARTVSSLFGPSQWRHLDRFLARSDQPSKKGKRCKL